MIFPVERLIAAQFPQWAHLPITPVEPGGWDNRTFRLGETMTVRLPSTPGQAGQAEKERCWLPVLAPGPVGAAGSCGRRSSPSPARATPAELAVISTRCSLVDQQRRVVSVDTPARTGATRSGG